MPDYTIPTADGDDWPPLPVGPAAALQPTSLPCEVLEEDGDLAFRVGGATVSASWELAGTWYVTVEDAASSAAADALVAEMASRLGEAAGKRAVHHRISD
ncbi:hypothetical protein [Streptomyces flavalbus]|uniref:Uncharacterized protein n=1 Tax=Streptomyces flavalbus TaxID=2665155 RepID=A0ABW2WLP1_9ACTN